MRQYIDICTSERCGNADFTLITGNISYRVQKSRIEDMFSTTSGDLKFKRSFTLPEEDVVRVNAAAFEMYLRALHHEDREMKLPPHTMLSFQLLQGIAKVCVRYGGEALIPESFKSALVMPRGFIDDFDVDFLPSLLVACELGWWNESKVLFREVLKHVSFNDEEYWVYRNDILLDNPDLPWSLCSKCLTTLKDNTHMNSKKERTEVLLTPLDSRGPPHSPRARPPSPHPHKHHPFLQPLGLLGCATRSLPPSRQCGLLDAAADRLRRHQHGVRYGNRLPFRESYVVERG